MDALTPPPIEVRTCPDDVPSVPPWFAEVVVLARHFTQRGYLATISQHLRLARGRAGTFEVLDFVAILLGYAVSGEPWRRSLIGWSPSPSPLWRSLAATACPIGPPSVASWPPSIRRASRPCASSSRMTCSRTAARMTRSVAFWLATAS